MTTQSKARVTARRINDSQLSKNLGLNRAPRSCNKIEYKELNNGTKVIRISFKDGIENGYVFDDGASIDFHHYCTESANKSICTHTTIAVGIADKLGLQVDRTMFYKDTSYLQSFQQLDNYKDCSLDFAVFDEESVPTTTTPTATLENMMDAIEDSPIIHVERTSWKAEYAEVLHYLQQEGAGATLIKEIQEMREAIFNEVKLTPMVSEPVKPSLPYTGPFLLKALRHILNGKDLMLYGEMGSGKDTLIASLAWVLGLPVYIQVGNINETKESIVGAQTFVNGEVTFELSPFATSVKYGGVSNYSELNMIPGKVTSIFHPVLDENRELPTKNGSLPRHKHHIFMASMNFGETYAGTSPVNAALMDRFAVLQLPQSMDLKELIIKKTGMKDAKVLEFLLEVKKQIDELITTEGTGSRSQTIRGYLDAAHFLKKYGVSDELKTEVLEDYIINKTEDKADQFAIRDRIRQSVFKKLAMNDEEKLYQEGFI
ncbi:hypothetical protein PaeCFBP13512_22280 [Paenibacillus sp. CFBP13512]|uniref:AAA family ATPase n=1 Tax=Paenibacillus sp. CFBP13512 TaxID=2184007 RepID=UPI0010C0FA33|nr:AAA family ATPase [Paenibacillus sp. CFBP13512]TKJ83851.1 hypothetical protein PaeCFBP13512_22280 [Paenibacillus sp. CFBP13512]